MDLAIIKPKYTTKNEFKVELPPNEDDLEEGALDRSEHAKRFK